MTISIEHLHHTPDTTTSPTSWLGSLTDLMQQVPASLAHCDRLGFLAWIRGALRLPLPPELTSKGGGRWLPTPLTTISGVSLRIAVLPHASTMQRKTGCTPRSCPWRCPLGPGIFSGSTAVCAPEPGLCIQDGNRSQPRFTPSLAPCPPS
jgi:hypothetical protein